MKQFQKDFLLEYLFLQLAEANVLILNTVTAEDESSECFTDKQHCFFQPILRQKLTTF